MTLQTASLLHADPVFPQRDLLLDSHYVAQQLASCLGRSCSMEIESCERVRATYRPGQSFRVVYKFRVDGQTGVVAARIFARETHRARVGDAFPPASCNSEWQSQFFDERTDTCFWIFPHDRKIASLPALMEVRPAFSELLDSQWVESHLVAYASEKCATIQCLDRQQRVLAYAKAYAGHEGLSCYNTYRALHSSGEEDSGNRFRVPRPILYSSSSQLLILEAIEGRRIADLEGEQLEQGMYELGRTMGEFHAVQVPQGVPEFTRFNSDDLREACVCIETVRPDLHDVLAGLCDSLCCHAHALLNTAVCLHGDVHPKNGILADGKIVLIDLDQTARGPAGADLGSLLAALRYDAITGELSPANAERFGQAFLSGYQVSQPLPASHELRWYTAAALLAERASRAITRIRTAGLEKLSEILFAAQEILEGQ